MKLIIMGVGYVGAALVELLKTSPHEIFLTTTDADKVESLRSSGKQVCLLSGKHEELDDLIDACDGMVILVAPKNAATYEETYLKVAQKIANSLEGRNHSFYLLYTSSTSVYEGIINASADENMALAPLSEKSKILLATEQCYLTSHADVCILRLGGIYGPNRELNQRAKHLSGKQMPGTGDEPTNHIHLNDIISAIDFCLESRLTGIYNLVNNDHPSRQRLYSDICESLKLPLPIWNTLNTQIEGYKVTNDKIRQAGFVFEHPSLNNPTSST